MAEATEFVPLSKDEFFEAKWAGPAGGLREVAPRWQGYIAELPEWGESILYPLRESNFGPVLPHIYASRMVQEDWRKVRGPLSELNLQVNMRYESTSEVDADQITANFHSLLRALDKPPYRSRPELGVSLEEIFAKYREMRAAQRVDAARALSRTISSHELYVVCSDSADWERPPDEKPLYGARLLRIINVTTGDSMRYDLVAKDAEGNEGILPSSFSVIAGVSAPAAQ